MPNSARFSAALVAALVVGVAGSVAGQPAGRPLDTCLPSRVEAVFVTADGRPPAAFEDVAHTVAFWFRPPARLGDRDAVVPVRVGRTLGVDVGTATGQGPADFLAAAHDAVAAAAHERVFDRFAPDSANRATEVAVHFGRAPGGGKVVLARRVTCTAMAAAENPTPDFPAEFKVGTRSSQLWLSAQSRTFTRGNVRAQFVVDSTGAIDATSMKVLDTTEPAFTREVRRVLPLMRYYPATIDGRPTAQIVEQEFAFEQH